MTLTICIEKNAPIFEYDPITGKNIRSFNLLESVIIPDAKKSLGLGFSYVIGNRHYAVSGLFSAIVK